MSRFRLPIVLIFSTIVLDGFSQKAGDEFVANNNEGIPIHYRILSVADKTVAVCGAKRKGNNVNTLIIPERVPYRSNTYIVKEIESRAFGNRNWPIITKIKHITFPSTLVSIGKEAFYNARLEEIILPEGLIEIGDYAFSLNSTKKLHIPNSVKIIGEKAFYWLDSKLNIMNLPPLVTIDNCKDFGFKKDDVERYYAYHPRDPSTLTTPQSVNNGPYSSQKQYPQPQDIPPNEPSSDVDLNIPQNAINNDNCFAVIIANEDYQREAKVDFAKNDGMTFKKYCHQVLGLPEKNVHLVENGTLNNMIYELDWLKQVCEAFKGETSVIFYYAGHGVPDEANGKAYLLPTDGTGKNLRTCLSTEELYKTLGDMPAKNITVLMDACFSGAKRSGEMLASARGVAIQAKQSAPKGNMVVLSAAKGDETANSYKENQHGLFTYFLLKKLKETKGTATLGELTEYVKDEVGRFSIVENGKSQTPTVSASPALGDNWRKIKLK